MLSLKKSNNDFSPNFAYNVHAEKIDEEELEGIDLSSLRLIVNAAEPIRHDSHQKFVERFKKYGFNPLALACLYGMAEVTLGLTVTEPGKPITELAVDRNELSRGVMNFADDNSVVRICVSSGKPIGQSEARIVDEKRNNIADGLVVRLRLNRFQCSTVTETIPKKQRRWLKTAGTSAAITF